MLMTIAEYIIAIPFLASFIILPSIYILIFGSMIKDTIAEIRS